MFMFQLIRWWIILNGIKEKVIKEFTQQVVLWQKYQRTMKCILRGGGGGGGGCNITAINLIYHVLCPLSMWFALKHAETTQVEVKRSEWHSSMKIDSTGQNMSGSASQVQYKYMAVPLTHLPQDKMAAIAQTIFSDAFSWKKVLYFD